jgi:hypothetical protein
MRRRLVCAAVVFAAAAAGLAQTTPREQLVRGQQLWDRRLSKSAIAALEPATHDSSTAAEADEALGRLYTHKGTAIREAKRRLRTVDPANPRFVF